MTEAQLFRFLIQVLVVLSAARLLGEAFRRAGQPPLAGEILAGLVLGQTVLGNLAPAVHVWLFPADPVQVALFDVVAQIGILFLLLAIGLEVDVVSAWKLRRQAVAVALAGVVLPLALGFGVAFAAHSRWAEVPADRTVFALLVGIAVSITAIGVVARLLLDLRIAKSDLGLLLLSALAINDLLGWAAAAVVLGMADAGAAPATAGGVAMRVVAAAALTAAAATAGRAGTTRLLTALDSRGFPKPSTPLSVVVCLGLAGGVAAAALGLHPVFGFLVAGLMAGDQRALSEHGREVIMQMVQAIFVPLFFASVALRVDFALNFAPGLILGITALSVGGKFFGALVGTWLAPVDRLDRLPIALAHIAGGSMEVLLGAVALEQGIIGPRLFVALVFASVSSSLMVGPAVAWALRKRSPQGVRRWLTVEGVVPELRARDRYAAIAELGAHAARLAGLPADAVVRAVRAREQTMGTGAGRGLALPHARFAALTRPVVVVGCSRNGIEWNAIDGERARLVFLILTPQHDEGSQLEILRTLGRGLSDPTVRADLLLLRDPDALFKALQARLRATEPEPGDL